MHTRSIVEGETEQQSGPEYDSLLRIRPKMRQLRCLQFDFRIVSQADNVILTRT